ncbi:MAG: hypothetical protein KGI29_04905, partial [Pseudomonadota bacterium]|nr:hypothetical protein [Pseudomonadota bacterium]
HRGRPPRGRGRRPWRGDGNPQESRVEAATPQSLPAFATQEPKPAPVPVPKREPEPVAAALESTPRDPNAPRKKGWWQKMIDLDE